MRVRPVQPAAARRVPPELETRGCPHLDHEGLQAALDGTVPHAELTGDGRVGQSHVQQGDDLAVHGVEFGSVGVPGPGIRVGRKQAPAPLEMRFEERTERGEQSGTVHDQRDRVDAFATGGERQQGDPPVDDDQFDGQLVDDGDVLALGCIGGYGRRCFGTFEPVALDDPRMAIPRRISTFSISSWLSSKVITAW